MVLKRNIYQHDNDINHHRTLNSLVLIITCQKTQPLVQQKGGVLCVWMMPQLGVKNVTIAKINLFCAENVQVSSYVITVEKVT